jgi:hypothetical protein
MKIRTNLLCIMAALILSISHAGSAEAVKTYQVTGPVLELSESKIVVQKGDEKWEISRDANSKSTEGLKIGSKVTIHYRMHATRIEVKDGAQKK